MNTTNVSQQSHHKRKRLTKIGLPALVALFMLGLLLSHNLFTAKAHDDRDVLGGKYQFRVGFINEPSYQGLLNGIELTICEGKCQSKGDGTFNNGVTGAFDTLKTEVIFGGQSVQLPLVAVPRNPGKYNAPFVPTRVGDYTFHFFGTIGTDQIDEKFTSGPNTFDAVQPLTAIQFPDKPGFSQSALASTSTATSSTPVASQPTPAAATTNNPPNVNPAEVQALKSQLDAQTKQLQDAKTSADSSGLLGILGIVLGGLGLLLGLGAVFVSRRSPQKREAEGG